jgi:hypothetical protein
MSLVMPWASVRVSRESLCCVMIRGVNHVQKIGNTWTLGVVQAIRVLCDFGPSFFGIRAWFHVSNLGRTYRCLDRMIVEDHVFI